MCTKAWLRTMLVITVLSGTVAAGEVPRSSDIIAEFDTLFRQPDETRAAREKGLGSGGGDGPAVDAPARPYNEIFSESIRATLDDVLSMADGDRVAVFCNYALAMHARTLSESEFHATWSVYRQLRDHLAVSPEDMVSAGVPLLESIHLNERKAGFTCLDAALGAGKEVPDLLLSFLQSQQAQGIEPSDALIDYMIQNDTVSALSDLRELYDIKGERDDRLRELQTLLDKNMGSGGGSLWRKADVKAVTTGLTARAEDPAWWVRLSVSEVMRRIPEVRVPEVVDQLRTDEHLLVRASVAAMGAWKGETRRPPKFRIQLSASDIEE